MLSQEAPNPDEDTFSSLPAQNQNFGIRIGKKRPMTTKHLSGAAVISQKKMQLLSYGAGSNKQSSQSGAFLFKNLKKRDKSGGESEEQTIFVNFFIFFACNIV